MHISWHCCDTAEAMLEEFSFNDEAKKSEPPTALKKMHELCMGHSAELTKRYLFCCIDEFIDFAVFMLQDVMISKTNFMISWTTVR